MEWRKPHNYEQVTNYFDRIYTHGYRKKWTGCLPAPFCICLFQISKNKMYITYYVAANDLKADHFTGVWNN